MRLGSPPNHVVPSRTPQRSLNIVTLIQYRTTFWATPAKLRRHAKRTCAFRIAAPGDIDLTDRNVGVFWDLDNIPTLRVHQSTAEDAAHLRVGLAGNIPVHLDFAAQFHLCILTCLCYVRIT